MEFLHLSFRVDFFCAKPMLGSIRMAMKITRRFKAIRFLVDPYNEENVELLPNELSVKLFDSKKKYEGILFPNMQIPLWEWDGDAVFSESFINCKSDIAFHKLNAKDRARKEL